MGYITVNNTVEGKIQNIEVLGNTYQDPNNLSVIKSCCNVLSDNTYKMSILSSNKNKFNSTLVLFNSDKYLSTTNYSIAPGVKLRKLKTYTITFEQTKIPRDVNVYTWAGTVKSRTLSVTSGILTFTLTGDEDGISFYAGNMGTSPYETLTTSYKVQIEEGSSSTSYESPLYNKSEILLPVQLEGLDTSRDRLYYDTTEKAWCIDKNTNTYIFKGTETISLVPAQDNDLTVYGEVRFDTLGLADVNTVIDKKILCNLLPCKATTQVWINTITDEGISKTDVRFNFRILKSKLGTLAIKDYLKGYCIKYPTNAPRKIVLPLSTQIALNSFMGTTHYYTDDTEIEPTIRGKFAKSLSAGYESLHNKTDILGDRIAGLEGLKDSQEFAYKTSTGYLNCLNTKDASVDNLKLSGRTLNNIVPNYTISWINNGTWQSKFLVAKTYSIVSNSVKVIQDIKPSTDYTIICNVTKNTSSSDIFIHNTSQLDVCYFNTPLKVVAGVTGYFVFKTKSISDFSTLITNDRVVLRSQNNGASTGEVEIKNIMVLEGDLTNCSPSYFEGMKSTGQDVNEIEVSSQNSGNLFNGTMENGGIGNTDGTIKAWANYIRTKDFIEVCSGIDYTFELLTSITISNLYISQYTKDKVFIKESVSAGLNKTTFTLDKATKYIKVYANKSTTFDTTNFISLSVCIGTKINSFASKQHKKQILYYNSTGQLVAIPELRGIWNGTTLVIGDTVEKHSDSKWYWHKRMLETTLNGSEVGWALEDGTLINTNLYSLMLTNLSGGITDLLCDKLPTKAIYSLDEEGISKHSTLNKLYIRLSKTKAPDLTTFKTYLSTNNHVLVHKSVTEEVYEVIDLHLDSYSNETMILLNGVIPAYIEWTVSSYLPNFVKDINEEVKTLQDRNVLMMASLLNIQTRLTAHGI